MKICAGIIGSGVGAKHFEAIQNYKKSLVKFICEKDKKKHLILKKKFKNTKIISNENEIFKDKNINLVSIASYDNHHFDQISKCIKYNKNIIVEKPMCLKLNELKKINNLLKKKPKIKITSNLVLRCNQFFNQVKKNISKDDIISIEADYLWGRRYKLREWRSKLKNYSIILGAGIHMIDLVMWLINSRPLSVQSFGNKIGTERSNFKKESFAYSIFEFPQKKIVKVSSNASGIFDHFHELKIFEKNKTLIHSYNGTFYLKKFGKKNYYDKIKPNYPDKKNRKKLIQNFIDEILFNKKKKFITVKEQIDLMSVCLAAEKSLKEGKKIKINYL